MINEASKLGIAMDLIEYKIAEVMIQKRDCNDEKTKIELEKKFKELMQEKKEIYAGNYDYINKIIEERKVNKND